ncbi:chemotaxis protein CheW [Janthinobacterium agaricidamnosum]|uniref:CheW-like domain protein n=1 Tax=Janthinobacterium agaricidamnosum NBRC 102515 = DSM 9628 TaxID=1349767 RepID=W0UY08_9BURK|nr:chemotaxis protein CheW [Janthinobacterium agaricidamnosum]CDG81429.1 cheW-like domain protein [Janthinobacterium agaricidamnosum NBRC 102515 = DSM 9628]
MTRDSAALEPSGPAARRGRLRQYQLQLLQRVQAAKSGAPASRKELGVLAGGRRYLLDLTQIGEIVQSAPISAVPLAQDWYLGLAAIRGKLTGVADLARYQGAAACAMSPDSRIITFAPRLGLNCALLVGAVLGLRQPGGDGGDQWQRLDLAALAREERFLQVGFEARKPGAQAMHTSIRETV